MRGAPRRGLILGLILKPQGTTLRPPCDTAKYGEYVKYVPSIAIVGLGYSFPSDIPTL